MRNSLILKSAGVCALALIFIGAVTTKSREPEGAEVVYSAAPEPSPTRTADRTHRNLALHPSAFNFNRRAGARYRSGRDSSVITGVLNLAGQSQTAQIARTQTADGERIQISLADGRSLTWTRESGASVAGGRGTTAERVLIERLVFDSADQFVLAQLSGASYFTVARNARPADATEPYTGATWTIVRVDDPERDELKRPASPWRLYYLNTATGLIDKIVSEVEGRRITAELTWMEFSGERMPTQIIWKHQDQILMQYAVTNFSRTSN